MPAGTPWGKLQKTEVSFVPRQSQPSPVRAEGEWCKANGWKRNQPLNMEPLTTPLPPMRPVRNISSIPGAAPDSSVPDTPLVTEAANDAAEEASADCPLATLDPYGSPVTLDPYGDGFDVNAFGDEPTPSDAYAVYGEDLAAGDEPAPSEDVMCFSCPCGITLEVHLDCVERCLFVLGLHNDYLKTTSGLCYDLMGIPICSL